ncbi:MAG: Hpt domain-containing protein, partial [Stellaceae bacterium]
MPGDADPLRYFRVEARDIVEAMGRDVLRLETTPAPDLVPRLLRLAHTLKGAARVVKQGEIADRAHAIEETLAPLRDLTAPPPAAVEALLRQVDAISAAVAALNRRETPSAPEAAEEPFERADGAELEGLYDAIAEAARQLRLARGALPSEIDRHGFDQAEREIEQALDAAAKLRLVPAAASVAV